MKKYCCIVLIIGFILSSCFSTIKLNDTLPSNSVQKKMIFEKEFYYNDLYHDYINECIASDSLAYKEYIGMEHVNMGLRPIRSPDLSPVFDMKIKDKTLVFRTCINKEGVPVMARLLDNEKVIDKYKDTIARLLLSYTFDGYIGDVCLLCENFTFKIDIRTK